MPTKKFWSVENAFKFAAMIIITLIAAGYLDWHASEDLGGFLKVLGLSIGIVVVIDILVSLGRKWLGAAVLLLLRMRDHG
jgi:hypothetical protein